MRKRSLALVAAGPVSRSFLARLASVTELIGPVRSFSFRQASRIANSLRAGFPAADDRAIEDVRAVFVCVPARLLPRMIGELLASPIDWHGRTVFLCDPDLDCRALAGLAARGAATASLMPMEGFDERRLVVEGDRPAVIAARRILAHGSVRLIELSPDSKAAYRAGIAFLSGLSIPMLSAAGDCLRRAGLSPHVTSQIIERLSQRTLRVYLKAGRKCLAGSKVQLDSAALEGLGSDLAATWTDAARIAARTRRKGAARAASTA